jgi:hypothetical protein
LSEVARVGGVVAALGLAVLVLAPRRAQRFFALLAWFAGCVALALWLAPDGHRVLYAGAAAAGLAAAGLLAALFVVVPWTLAVAILACAPVRVQLSIGDTDGKLLVPLYLVTAAAALALGWQFVRGDRRARELGVVAWPVALLVAWTGLSFAWSVDARQGAIFLLFYLLPFGLLAVAVSRLPWREGWVRALYLELAGMALVFGLIGGWQYLTRDVFWNPKVIVANAYAPSAWFYRVNSVFYDPSIYGRFLVVAIVAGLVLVLFGRGAGAVAAALAAGVTWLGLLPSFSQSSFLALGIAGLIVLASYWWRRGALAIAIVALLALGAGITAATARDSGVAHAMGGRARLVSNGVRIAIDHPVVGVGAGGFRRAYAERVGLKGREPKSAASHNTAVTIAAETGGVGLALFAWLLAAAFVVALRGVPSATRIALAGILIALLVHCLFYDALLQDVMFWGVVALLAASGAATTVGARAGDRRSAA